MVTKEQVLEALRDCYDPEIPINIVDLGLIRGVDVCEDGKVAIQMTMTTPFCPWAGELAAEVKSKAESVPGVAETSLELVWNPPWHPSEATEEGQWQLKAMGVMW